MAYKYFESDLDFRIAKLLYDEQYMVTKLGIKLLQDRLTNAKNTIIDSTDDAKKDLERATFGGQPFVGDIMDKSHKKGKDIKHDILGLKILAVHSRVEDGPGSEVHETVLKLCNDKKHNKKLPYYGKIGLIITKILQCICNDNIIKKFETDFKDNANDFIWIRTKGFYYLYNMENWGKAVEMLNKANDINKIDPQTIMWLALGLCKLGKSGDIVKLFDSLEIKDDIVVRVLKEYFVYESINAPDKSIGKFESMLKENKNFFTMVFWLNCHSKIENNTDYFINAAKDIHSDSKSEDACPTTYQECFQLFFDKYFQGSSEIYTGYKDGGEYRTTIKALLCNITGYSMLYLTGSYDNAHKMGWNGISASFDEPSSMIINAGARYIASNSKPDEAINIDEAKYDKYSYAFCGMMADTSNNDIENHLNKLKDISSSYHYMYICCLFGKGNIKKCYNEMLIYCNKYKNDYFGFGQLGIYYISNKNYSAGYACLNKSLSLNKKMFYKIPYFVSYYAESARILGKINESYDIFNNIAYKMVPATSKRSSEFDSFTPMIIEKYCLVLLLKGELKDFGYYLGKKGSGKMYYIESEYYCYNKDYDNALKYAGKKDDNIYCNAVAYRACKALGNGEESTWESKIKDYIGKHSDQSELISYLNAILGAKPSNADFMTAQAFICSQSQDNASLLYAELIKANDDNTRKGIISGKGCDCIPPPKSSGKALNYDIETIYDLSTKDTNKLEFIPGSGKKSIPTDSDNPGSVSNAEAESKTDDTGTGGGGTAADDGDKKKKKGGKKGKGGKDAKGKGKGKKGGGKKKKGKKKPPPKKVEEVKEEEPELPVPPMIKFEDIDRGKALKEMRDLNSKRENPKASEVKTWDFNKCAQWVSMLPFYGYTDYYKQCFTVMKVNGEALLGVTQGGADMLLMDWGFDNPAHSARLVVEVKKMVQRDAQ